MECGAVNAIYTIHVSFDSLINLADMLQFFCMIDNVNVLR